MIGIIPVRLIVIFLFGCICIFSIAPITYAFVDLDELNATIEQFLDIFIDLGGRELLERLEQGEDIDRQYFEDLDAFFGLPCLLSAIRFNRHAKEAASTKCYDKVSVCLTDQEGFKECPPNEMITFTDKLDASGSEFRYLNDESNMPPNLQGMFWLNYRLASSSITSFAKTRDGGDLSTGVFDSDQENISYRIRVAGVRNWAFEIDSITSSYGTMKAFDFIYEFKVTQGTNEDPEHITIFLSFIVPFFPIFHFHPRECFQWSTPRYLVKVSRYASIIYIALKVFLVKDESVKGKYTNSVYCWDRLSTSIFLKEDSLYPFIQLIDRNGNAIEPAYGDWLRDQSNKAISGQDHPNENLFHVLDSDTSASDCLQR